MVFYVQNSINMPCGNFDCVTCHNLKPSKMNNHNGWWTLTFQKKSSKFFHNVVCFDEWMKSDVNMTIWL